MEAPQDQAAAVEHAFRDSFSRRPSESALNTVTLQAGLHLRHQSWAAAIQCADAVLRHRPNSVDALLTLGVASGAKGDLELSLIALETLLGFDADNVDAWYNLGNVRIERGDTEGAEQAFRKCLALDAHNHAATYGLARTLDGLGRDAEAIVTYDRVVTTAPDREGWGFRGFDFREEARAALKRLRP
jgi:tetratricopeptide (TPR) repeat protein